MAKPAKPTKTTKTTKTTKPVSAAAKAKAKAAAKAKRRAEIDEQNVGSWIECASSTAEGMRMRMSARIAKLEDDACYAKLACDVWREHRDRAPDVQPVFARYLALVAEQTRALREMSEALTPIIDVPEKQHVHLAEGTVTIERVRAANVKTAYES